MFDTTNRVHRVVATYRGSCCENCPASACPVPATSDSVKEIGREGEGQCRWNTGVEREDDDDDDDDRNGGDGDDDLLSRRAQWAAIVPLVLPYNFVLPDSHHGEMQQYGSLSDIGDEE